MNHFDRVNSFQHPALKFFVKLADYFAQDLLKPDCGNGG